MIFTPPMLFQIYEVTLFDPMHRYLSMVSGSLLVVIAIGAGLSFLQPVRFAGIVLILVLYHLARFVVDIILLAQGEIAVTTLLPEMVYFVVMSALLVRFFPVEKKEQVIEDEQKAPEAKSDELPQVKDVGELS